MRDNMLKWSVQEGGVSLLTFLKERIKNTTSVKAIKRAIDGRSCLVNERIERFGSRRLKPGDQVKFLLKTETAKAPLIKKLYEDQHLLAIDKPVHRICSDQELQKLLSDYKGKIWLAHRLDKETSGVLLLAKSLEAKERLRELFAQRKIEKRYIALVHGLMFNEEGQIDSRLVVKKRLSGQTIYGNSCDGRGERALTFWKCLERRAKVTLIECKPVTGRTHQIRVHMSSIGHPIVGDLQYGKRIYEEGVERCLLHAQQLKFIHPFSGEGVLIEAVVPKEIIDS